MSGPLVPGAAKAVLVQVITAAGGTCECEGACGGREPGHRVGRSDSGAYLYGEECGVSWLASKGGPLIAAPRDPEVPEHELWRTPTSELAAWCTSCWLAARKLTQAQRNTELRQSQESLFEFPKTVSTKRSGRPRRSAA